MIILDGLAPAPGRSAAPLVTGHDADAGRIAAASPSLAHDPVWPLRKGDTGNSLLEEIGLTALTPEESKFIGKTAKASFASMDPLAKGLVKYAELAQSSHEAWTSARGGDRPWITELHTACGLVEKAVGVLTVTIPQLKGNAFVGALKGTLALSEVVLKALKPEPPKAPSP